jgi:resuscitation-promoting factor RpfB
MTNGTIIQGAICALGWSDGRAMRLAMKIASAVSGLIVLSACGSGGASTAAGTATATPSVASSGRPQASPVVEKRVVIKRRAIPFKTLRVNDPTLSKGITKVRHRGVPGVKRLTYRVTFVNGIQTHKKLINKVVVRAPVARVIAVGTREVQQCDPNYSGACVPIASDVDCAGGSGNGPAYVQGPVRVIGTDIYGLDSDGDGIGCES